MDRKGLEGIGQMKANGIPTARTWAERPVSVLHSSESKKFMKVSVVIDPCNTHELHSLKMQAIEVGMTIGSNLIISKRNTTFRIYTLLLWLKHSLLTFLLKSDISLSL